MILNNFEIKRYDFTPKVFNDLQNAHYAKDLWPIVYVLSDGNVKEAYVGETTDTYSRLSNHLKTDAKSKLSVVHLISSEKFNKSATLDIESNLIKYISGDGQYKLINGNIGLANHNYYQKKEVYWDIFTSIWDKLRAEGISKHSIEHINNSDLFKYSPYKSLNKEQKEGLLTILKSLLNKDAKTILVEGGAGTGKTILATFLFKLLKSNISELDLGGFGDDEKELIDLVIELKKRYPDPSMALIVPMASFRETLKRVFKNVKGLSANMVIGPADLAREKFDIVLVDESHRLRRRVNLGSYFHSFDVACEKLGFNKDICSELDWVLKQSNQAILFYDENQSIKPSDARKEDFDKLKATKSTKVEYLKSQFRVKGGNGYVRYIDNLLNTKLEVTEKIFNAKDYEFVLFDKIEDMVREIKLRDKESGLARLIAGYSWKWDSRKEGVDFDIKIENTSLKWNSVAKDFINSPNAINEVACIHTTQGYDLNYSGVIFGNEITYDKEKDEIIILKENYHDTAGKSSITDPEELKNFIINIYKTIMLRGIKGTYIYACDKDLREYFAEHITNYRTEKVIPQINKANVIPFENAVPVFDLKAAAGDFSDLQDITDRYEDFDWVEIPSRYKASKDLFACTVVGESMNKVIPNGSKCLFRNDSGGSRNGKIVLVEHTSIQDPDTGSRYTVKEYSSIKNNDGDQWSHESIILKPLSYNPEYEKIVLSEDEVSNLRVIGIFESVL